MAIGLLILALAQVTPVWAATSAKARPSTVVRSASWALVALPQGAAAGTGPLTINWFSIKGVHYSYVDLASTGTIPVVGGSFTLNTVKDSGNPKLLTITIEACVGAAWVARTNSCPAVLQSFGSTVAGTLSSSFTLAAGARLSLRVTSSGNPGSDVTTTMSTSVSRAQARAGVTTNA